MQLPPPPLSTPASSASAAHPGLLRHRPTLPPPWPLPPPAADSLCPMEARVRTMQDRRRKDRRRRAQLQPLTPRFFYRLDT